MRAIDQAFATWLAKVEFLVGRAVDRQQACSAFTCFEPPYKPLTPQEYARELQELY